MHNRNILQLQQQSINQANKQTVLQSAPKIVILFEAIESKERSFAAAATSVCFCFCCCSCSTCMCISEVINFSVMISE